MSCISSNFSSFFLNTLNDPSEFSKYLSNGELKCTNFEEFQVFATQQSTQQQQQQQLQYSHSNGVSVGSATAASTAGEFAYDAAAAETPAMTASTTTTATPPTSSAAAAQSTLPLSNRWPTAVATPNGHAPAAAAVAAAAAAAQHFDGSFEFIKYLRHSTDFTPTGGSGSNGGGGGGGSSSAGSVGDAADCAATADKASKLAAGAVAGRGLTASPPLPLPASPVGASGGGGGVGGIGLLDLDSTSIAQKSRSASRKVAALLSSVSRSSNSLDANSSTLDAVFDHDSKQTMFELQHLTSTSNGSNGSNSNESSLELLAFPNSHLNASNSNTSSEEHCGEFGMGLLSGASCSSASTGAGGAPKLLGSFVIKENFDVHPSHKVEEGIFQHMNKLPSKKKDTLKQLGVRFTGQMTFTDKSIVVENFIKFCEEYDIKDHRPWLSLNQCGLNKPEQIKFARYLGQGLPTFTLFCIYSNFKNLFCTKRTEIYTKDGYNLPYILDKTKRFLANTTADLKNMAAANDGSLEFASSSNNSSSSGSNSNNNNNSNCNVNSNSSSSVNSNSNSSVNSLNSASLSSNTVNSYITAAVQQQQAYAGTSAGTALPLLPPPPLPHSTHHLGPPPRSLEQLIIYENFPVHEQHRIEDGVCTHISRLPPKKQELLKQFGIQSSSQQCLSNYEKCILIENFIKFCNEYQISDHRPFLDFHESALSKCEQLKFVRYLGQGLSNLTLNKIYVAFKDLLGNGRSEKAGVDNYSLDAILKKKRKNLYNRLHAAASSVDLTSYDAAAQQAQQPPTQSPQHTLIAAAAPRPHHAFAALTAATPHGSSSSSEVSNDLTLTTQYNYAAPR